MAHWRFICLQAGALLISHFSPDLVQGVLDALPTPVFIKDRQGRYQGCNRAYCELTGKRREELMGLTVFDLLPDEAARAHFEVDEALMRDGGEQRYEARVQHPDGRRRDVIFHKAAVRGPDGLVSGLISTILDITERKALESKLAELAERDHLTGLLNRRAILAYLEGLHADRRHAREALCLMMCDVDHFKSINDRFGHAVGDEVLRQVAQVLRHSLRDADRLGRIGGEEFLIVLGSTDLEGARQVAERLRQQVAALHVVSAGHTLGVTISIGLARSLRQDEDWAEIITRADEGLYAAKRTGRDRVVVAEASARGLLQKDWHQG